MTPGCDNDRIPSLCAEKFEHIARGLSNIEGHTSAMLNDLAELGRKIEHLSGRHASLENRATLLEAHNSREDAWRKRIWQLVVGAALVVLGATLR
jgi:hypothetical protein